jgi:hypothetical protein
MNANELAEIADGLSIEIPIREWIDNEPKNVMNDIATKLRQQQESIEGLNRDYDLLFAEHQLLLKKERVELTDEEIMKIANEVSKDYKNWHHYQLDFARAILRKVQEK